VPNVTTEVDEAADDPQNVLANVGPTRFKRILIPASLVIAGVAIGTIFSSVGLTEFITGQRFSYQELKDATEEARQSGYEDGKADGFSQGFTSGQDSGECSIFDEIGDNLIAIRWPFYKLNVYGNYYTRSYFGC
jgi:hypothetical protein